MRRFWTDNERDVLRAEYGRTPACALAERLDRTTRAVYQEATKLGLVEVQFRADDTFFVEARRLNAEGHSDTEIAERFGCDRHAVSRHRKRMGLPSQSFSSRRRQKVRERTNAQCAAVGVNSVGALRSLVFKLRSIESGWGENLRPRHIQILDLLSARGPQSRRQIAEALGMPWKGSRHSLKSNDDEGSYLAHLMARGLVVSLGRIVKGRGKGYSTNLYCLAITAEKDDESSEKVFGPGVTRGDRRLAGEDATGGLRGTR